MATQLNSGDVMPSIIGKDVDGNDVDIISSVAGDWAVVQFFRGHW